MPYIDKADRAEFGESLANIIDDLESTGFKVGEYNFVLSTILWSAFRADACYTRANNLLGVLEAVKLEFYRRKVAVLEDSKIKENGDL